MLINMDGDRRHNGRRRRASISGDDEIGCKFTFFLFLKIRRLQLLRRKGSGSGCNLLFSHGSGESDPDPLFFVTLANLAQIRCYLPLKFSPLFSAMSCNRELSILLPRSSLATSAAMTTKSNPISDWIPAD